MFKRELGRGVAVLDEVGRRAIACVDYLMATLTHPFRKNTESMETDNESLYAVYLDSGSVYWDHLDLPSRAQANEVVALRLETLSPILPEDAVFGTYSLAGAAKGRKRTGFAIAQLQEVVRLREAAGPLPDIVARSEEGSTVVLDAGHSHRQRILKWCLHPLFLGGVSLVCLLVAIETYGVRRQEAIQVEIRRVAAAARVDQAELQALQNLRLSNASEPVGAMVSNLQSVDLPSTVRLTRVQVDRFSVRVEGFVPTESGLSDLEALGNLQRRQDPRPDWDRFSWQGQGSAEVTQ